MKKQFIMIIPGEHEANTIFCDMNSDSRIIVKKKALSPIIFPLHVLRKIHLGKRMNRIINLPFKGIWNKTYTLSEINWDNETQYYVIFTNISLAPISFSYLNGLKKKYNVKFILYMLDSMHTRQAETARNYIKNVDFDYIFAFDKVDEDAENIYLAKTHYSMLWNGGTTNDSIGYDLYFIGWPKDRLKRILDVYSALIENKGKGLFRIVDVKKKDMLYKDQIIYNEKIPYLQAVQEAVRANCILDIVQGGQFGATLRYYEAVCYNKKLLTTDKNVVNLPFYSPEYMKVFEKPEDIDWEWVKKREPIDYGYDGRFSPLRLIDKILELEKEKEGF